MLGRMTTTGSRSSSRLRDVVRLVAVIAVIAIPAVVLAFTPLASGIELFFVGVIPGLLGSLYGRRLALASVVATAVLIALVELANPFPIAATGLMIGVGLLIGLCGVRGWHTIATASAGWPATLLIGMPFAVSGVDWLSTGAGQVLVPAALALLGGLWSMAVGVVVLRGVPRSAAAPLRDAVALIYGLCLAVLLGVTTFVASTWFHGTTAGWALLTIFVVARPGLAETNSRIITRVLGTIAGGLVAALVAFAVPIHAVHVAIGLVALVAAIGMQVKKTSYAVYAFTLTASIVMLNSPGTDVLPVDLERVLYTVAGALFAGLLVLVLEVGLRPWLKKMRTNE